MKSSKPVSRLDVVLQAGIKEKAVLLGSETNDTGSALPSWPDPSAVKKSGAFFVKLLVGISLLVAVPTVAIATGTAYATAPFKSQSPSSAQTNSTSSPATPSHSPPPSPSSPSTPSSPPPPMQGAVCVIDPTTNSGVWPCFATADEANAASPQGTHHTHLWTHLASYTCHMPDGFTGAIHANNNAPCPAEAVHFSPSNPPPVLSPPPPSPPPPFSPPPPSPLPPSQPDTHKWFWANENENCINACGRQSLDSTSWLCRQNYARQLIHGDGRMTADGGTSLYDLGRYNNDFAKTDFYAELVVQANANSAPTFYDTDCWNSGSLGHGNFQTVFGVSYLPAVTSSTTDLLGTTVYKQCEQLAKDDSYEYGNYFECDSSAASYRRICPCWPLDFGP